MRESSERVCRAERRWSPVGVGVTDKNQHSSPTPCGGKNFGCLLVPTVFRGWELLFIWEGSIGYPAGKSVLSEGDYRMGGH